MQIPGLKISQPLGQGRTGTVYLATQSSREQTLAVRVFHPALAGHPTFPARLRETLRRLALVRHRGVVVIHDIAVPGERLYMVMEYLPGGSLAQRLEEGLFLGEALNLIRDISRALAVAHGQGMVHGCLSPGNVLFALEGRPVLTDFAVCLDPDREIGQADDLRQLGELFRQLLIGRPAGEGTPLPDDLARFRPLLARLGAAGSPQGYGRVEDFEADLERLLRLPAPVPAADEKGVEPEPAAPPAREMIIAAPAPTRELPRLLEKPLPASRSAPRRRKALAAALLLPLVAGAGAGGWLLTRQPVPPASAAAVESVTVEEATARPTPADPEADSLEPVALPPPKPQQSAPQEEVLAEEETLAGFEPVAATEDTGPSTPAQASDPIESLALEISQGLALAAVIPPDRTPALDQPAARPVADIPARIDRLKERFEALVGDWQLTQGRNGHALGVLEEIRRLDPDHPFLAEGRWRVAVAYANLARAALDRGELKYARRWIDRGEKVQRLTLFTDLRRELDSRYRLLSDLTGADARPAPKQEPAPSRDSRPPAQGRGLPFGWNSR